MTVQQYEALKKPFELRFINFRITSTTKVKDKGIAVAYLDSRAIQNRLDEVVGCGNWQDGYEIIHTNNGKEPTAYLCTISIFNEQRGEWISKSNGAASTDIEPVKGGLSDAFKRAASMWGIGRYLYDFEGAWVALNQYKQIEKSEYPKLENKYRELVQNILRNNAQKNVSPIPPQAAVTKPLSAPPPTEKNTPKFVGSTQPVYTVVNAKYEASYSIYDLFDGKNRIRVFLNGTAMLRCGQQITNVKLERKESTGIEYFVLVDYLIVVPHVEIAA